MRENLASSMQAVLVVSGQAALAYSPARGPDNVSSSRRLPGRLQALGSWEKLRVAERLVPIHLDIFHPNRIVVVVARGSITADDVMQAVREFMEKGATHYRKIIDVSMARSDMDMAKLETLAAFARANQRDRGPLAFVVERMGNPLAHAFAKLTEGERPVKVFTSLHEARRWLDENSKI